MKTYPMGTIELTEDGHRATYDIKVCPFCGEQLEHRYTGAYKFVDSFHSPTMCRFSLSDLTNKTSRLINFVDADGWDTYFTWDDEGDLWAFLPREDYDNSIGHMLMPVGKKLLKQKLIEAEKFHQGNLNNCLTAHSILDNKE